MCRSRVPVALALLFAGLACAPGCAPDARPRIVVIGWDGADWDAVRDLIGQGRLPHLAKLMREGASGRLHSYLPMLSPLIWTSIATGKEPPAHGVLDFLTLDEGSGRIVPVTSDERRTKALWNLLGDHGLRSAFVGWLVTFPAEEVPGYVVSERVSLLSFAHHAEVDTSLPAGKTHPPGLYDEIEPLIVQPAEIAGGTVRERFELGALPDEARLAQLRGSLAQTETYRRIALHLLGRRDVDLFAAYFEAIDAMSHLFIRATPPLLPGTSEEEMRRYGRVIGRTYELLDEILGEIVERLADDATVYVVSDHGFKTGDARIPFEDSSMDAAYAADWHRDNGILVVRGPGVRRGHAIEEAHVLDVTPTLLAQLGIPAGRDMPGRALVGIWEPDAAPIPPEPVETHDATGWREAEGPAAPGSGADDERVKQRLQALGYVAAGRAAVHSNESMNLAIYFAHRKAYARALEAVQAAIAANPKNSSAWKTLGEIQIRMGRYTEAIDALLQVAALRRDAIEVHRTLAGLYEQVGQHPRALAILEPLAARHPEDPRIPARLGTLHARAGNYDEACRHYERSLSLYPHQDRVRYELLAARAMSGRGDEVLRSLEAAPPAASIDLPLELGKVFFRLGDAPRASAAFELAIRRDGSAAEPHFHRGLLELSRNDPQAALESFEVALRLDPDHTGARLNEGLAYLRAGRLEESIATLQAILEDDPGHAPAHTLMGEAYLASGRIGEARRHLERALELDPSAPKAARLLGQIADD